MSYLQALSATSDLQPLLNARSRPIGSEHLDGYWLHLDVDILDPTCMPAADSPNSDGIDPQHLADCSQHSHLAPLG